MQADVHSHVLCGIDDGARNAAETARLLTALAQNGTTHLALTPHFNASRQPLDAFVRDRAAAFETVSSLPEAEGFTFSLGAELSLTDTIFNYEDITPLCYTGTRYVLTELEYTDRFTATAEKRLHRFSGEFNVIPVLAHVDRFPYLMKDRGVLESLYQMGCLFQWNLDSALSFLGRRRMLRFFRRGLVHFLGEDVHRSVTEGAKREKLVSRLAAAEPALFSATDRMAKEEIFSGR